MTFTDKSNRTLWGAGVESKSPIAANVHLKLRASAWGGPAFLVQQVEEKGVVLVWKKFYFTFSSFLIHHNLWLSLGSGQGEHVSIERDGIKNPKNQELAISTLGCFSCSMQYVKGRQPEGF